MARRTFYATRSDGGMVERTSENRVYTHCVAIYKTVEPGTSIYYPDGYSGWLNTEWAGNHALALKNAARYNGKPGYRAEVLEARELPKVQKKVRS